MGNILNPTEYNSFIKLVKFKDSEIFVDKTDFIEKISAKVNTQNCFLAITRPRRFGKTVTAHMLSAYYSKGYAGKKIFEKLEIANKPSFAEHQNKYNVIYICKCQYHLVKKRASQKCLIFVVVEYISTFESI